MTNDEVRDLARNAVAGLRAVENSGHLTSEEIFLVQTAQAALLYLSDTYNLPIDRNAPSRPVVIDGTALLKDAVGPDKNDKTPGPGEAHSPILGSTGELP